MAQRPLEPYEPPEVADISLELPPPMRGKRGESVYDEVILATADHEGQWVAVDPKGRSAGAFRTGVVDRLEKLGLEMLVKQRGAYMYMKFEGGGEPVEALIERVRAESRAAYGE